MSIWGTVAPDSKYIFQPQNSVAWIISGVQETNFLQADIQRFEYTARPCTSIMEIVCQIIWNKENLKQNVKICNYNKLKTIGFPYSVL